MRIGNGFFRLKDILRYQVFAMVIFAAMPCTAQLVNVVPVPAITEVEEGESFTFTIRVEPEAGAQVSVADVSMSFNPALLQVTSVSLAPGSLLNFPSAPITFDNAAGTLFAGGFGFAAASTAFNHVVINFQAIGSGSTSVSHIIEGFPTTIMAFAGFDVTGLIPSATVIIGGGSPPDCAGFPGMSAFLDLCGNCVGGTTGLSPCVQDCAGVFGGSAFIDACGTCVGGTTGLEPCAPCTVVGGTVASQSPRQNLCIGDGVPNIVQLTVSGNTGQGRFGIARQSDLQIVAINGTGTFNMENYPAVTYVAGYISVNNLSDIQGVTNVNGLSGCYELSNFLVITTVALNAGTISANNGTTACGNDGIASNLSFTSTGAVGPNFRWAVLTQNFTTVLANNTTGIFNFDLFGPGAYRVVRIVYSNVNLGTIIPPTLPACVAQSNTITVIITSCALSLQSQPNPTPGESNVSFTAVNDEWHTLEVFDVQGRLVKTLMSRVAQAGEQYRFTFDGSYLPNGVYIYRLTTDSEVLTERFLIAK